MRPEGKFDTPRNRAATCLANLCLRLATREYRNFIEAVIWYGMSAAAENMIKGKPHPVSWLYAVKREDV